MKGIRLLGLVIIVTCILLGLCYLKEGFANQSDIASYGTYVKTSQKKFNEIGEVLKISNNIGIFGENSDKLFDSIIETKDENGQPIQKPMTNYPLETKESGISLIIKKCEAVKSTDCNVFNNNDFTKDCGICLDIGKDSKGTAHSGGLVLMDGEKKEARDRVKNTPFLPPYEPVIGSCPSGKLVSTKKECLRLQKQLQCEKGSTFENPTGCSQCFQSGEYSIVDPNDSDIQNLIVGGGTLLIWGSAGSFTYQSMTNNNQQTYDLTDTPRELRLNGGEGSEFTISVKAFNVPVEYDETEVYKVGDLIIFNDKVYRMNDGTGQPGYSPSTSNQQQRWDDLGSYQRYSGAKVKQIPQISGILIGQTNVQGAIFQIDLNRLIIVDNETGRKARVTGTVKPFQYSNRSTFGPVMLNPVFKLSPGFGKETMRLRCTQPFSFVDIQSQESTRCPSSPFVTKEASATFLQNDPCYKKGSGPGKYSVECLQGLFLSNGCTSQGGGYPKDQNNSLNATMFDLASLADYIYEKAIITATGVSSSGIKQELTNWSEASVFCTGKKINSPCDISMGIVSDDCIFYLWDNTGDGTEAGSGYASSIFQMASGTSDNHTLRKFCTREGVLSPKNPNGTINSANLTYWKKFKTAQAVKNEMSKLHQKANDKNISDLQRTPFIQQCYGIVINNTPPPPRVSRNFKGVPPGTSI